MSPMLCFPTGTIELPLLAALLLGTNLLADPSRKRLTGHPDGMTNGEWIPPTGFVVGTRIAGERQFILRCAPAFDYMLKIDINDNERLPHSIVM